MQAVVWDVECTDLKADVGALIVVSIGYLDTSGQLSRVVTQDINSIGKGSRDQREKKLALWTRDRLEEADILIGHNSLAFDRHFLDGVLARHGERMLAKRVHWDTMQIAKGKLAMGVSMSNLADVLLKGSKDAPRKDDWRLGNLLDEESIKRLRQRCESDVRVTADLWNRLKPVFYERHGR